MEHQESGNPRTTSRPVPKRLQAESGLVADLIILLGNTRGRGEICSTVIRMVSDLTRAQTIRLTSIGDDDLWEETVETDGVRRTAEWTPSHLSKPLLAGGDAITRIGGIGLPGISAYIGVPLRHSGQTIGVLEVENPRAPERIGNYLRSMRLIGGVAAVALANSRLLTAIESRGREWQRTFDAMGDGVAIVSKDHIIIRANRALAVMTGGADPEELVGRHCFEVVHGRSAPVVGCPLESCLAARESYEIERQELRLNNIWVHHRVDPIPGPRGEVTGAVHSFRDITGRKEMEQIKEEFIGLVSHELRNPLTVMIGALQTALEDGAKLSREDMTQLISDAALEAHDMSDMVGNMLDLSRSDANRLSLEIEPINISEVIRGICGKFRNRYPGRVLVADLPAELPNVRADRLRVERVLHNLLHNAIKYSPDGGEIRVIAKAVDSELVVCVKDQGIGISGEDQSRLFQPFYRATDASKIDAQGSGLGLVVCRRIVEAHGGRIWLESRAGEGSTFFFTIPLA
ncbi:MAG: ATP-binding protein [Dehalococcoidia bacterium]|nr:ATP-binding protein [Dehalococcoidia bacterium]